MSPVLNTALGQARAAGMRLRAKTDRPTATTEHMPFKSHRTCAEWEQLPGRRYFGKVEQTDEERRDDAVTGSATLRDAIMKASKR